MKNQDGSVTLGLIVFLGLIYMSLFFVSCNGYGYMGYNGYHRGPSILFWGGPRVYHQPHNIRGGSIGNRSRRGGGFGSGK